MLRKSVCREWRIRLGRVDGGEDGVVQLVHGEDGVLSCGSGAAIQAGENKAEGKRNAANTLAPRVENKRNRNGVPVTWDGAAVTTTNIVSQPRNRERTRPSNFRSGTFLVTIPVPYREATASGKFNESRFADIDKHLKLGAIVERVSISAEPADVPDQEPADTHFKIVQLVTNVIFLKEVCGDTKKGKGKVYLWKASDSQGMSLVQSLENSFWTSIIGSPDLVRFSGHADQPANEYCWLWKEGGRNTRNYP
eukprot:g19578.t1